MEVRDTKVATSIGGMRKISRKAGEYKSERRRVSLSSGGQSSKAMKEKVWHNWRMEENCLRVRLIRAPGSIKRSAGGRLMEGSP
jgi:hypothetical protein